HGATPIRMWHSFDTNIDTILWGCLAALLWHHSAIHDWLYNRLRRHWVPTFLLTALTLSLLTLGNPVTYTAAPENQIFWLVQKPLFAAICGSFILSLLTCKTHPIRKALELPPCLYLGRISYSLYL